MHSRVTRMSHLTPAWYWFRRHPKSDVLQRQVDPPDVNSAWCTASRRSAGGAPCRHGLRGSGPSTGTCNKAASSALRDLQR